MRGRKLRRLGFAAGLTFSLGVQAAPPSAAPPPAIEQVRYLCRETAPLWQRTKTPGLSSYCQLSSRARARVWTSPADARRSANEAEALVPFGLEARLLVVEAEHAAGDTARAVSLLATLLSEPSAPDVRRLLPADVLLLARVANLAEDRPAALGHYRALALSLEGIASSTERARALVEAAIIAWQESPENLWEARAYLRQSRLHFSPRLDPVRALLAERLEPSGQEAGRAERLEILVAQTEWILGAAPAARGAPREFLPVLSVGQRQLLLATKTAGSPEFPGPVDGWDEVPP